MEQLSHTEWHLRPERAPVPNEHEELIYDLPGRVLRMGQHDVCSRSYWIRIVRHFNSLYLLVRHGGGDERHEIGRADELHLYEGLTDEQRYRMFANILRIIHASTERGYDRAQATYRQAFVEGRLHKRKLRGQEGYKVWID